MGLWKRCWMPRGAIIKPLTEIRLCQWHALLFPSGLSGMTLVNPGFWRNDHEGPMQVVSGYYGREKVHFQAPPANQLLKEIKQFLKWFKNSQKNTDPLIRSAISHLWFVTIHPFDDGNRRITRAITDMALAQAEDIPHRFYSMSTQIRKQRKSYYDILEKTQKGSLDITEWLLWFLDCLKKAMLQSASLLQFVLNKSEFWKQHAKSALNKRQIAMLNHLFDAFDGKLTSSKWAKMMQCSQDTATRDINQLIEFAILIKGPESGRSASYLLKDYPTRQISR